MRSTVPENRDSQAVFRCVSCSHTANADLNAARNIRAAILPEGTGCTDVATRCVNLLNVCAVLESPPGRARRMAKLARSSPAREVKAGGGERVACAESTNRKGM
ncbi:zinc ribbon domain-containing protein [Corynebacterium bovis]|uniref:zinc ribbon domain-containing protein n=1 Tax=Corynebacterium bovis TaxID=36808 RepID=UPI00313A4B2D